MNTTQGERIYCGDKVNVIYLGHQVVGTIEDMRVVHHENDILVVVNLDQPLDILGLVRDDVWIKCDREGRGHHSEITSKIGV